MTMEERIKEMAELTFDYVDSKNVSKLYLMGSNADEEMKPLLHNYGLAEFLYNAGYRKVLLDTEYGKDVDCAQYVPWNFIDWYTEREVKKARKETAKEILQCMYDKCYEIQNMGRGGIAHISPIDILQLAKHYGVDIEE